MHGLVEVTVQFPGVGQALLQLSLEKMGEILVSQRFAPLCSWRHKLDVLQLSLCCLGSRAAAGRPKILGEFWPGRRVFREVGCITGFAIFPFLMQKEKTCVGGWRE